MHGIDQTRFPIRKQEIEVKSLSLESLWLINQYFSLKIKKDLNTQQLGSRCKVCVTN